MMMLRPYHAVPCTHIQTHLKYCNLFFRSFSIHFISIFFFFFGVVCRHFSVSFLCFVRYFCRWFTHFFSILLSKNPGKMVKEMRRIIVAEKCTPGRIWPIVLCRCHEVDELCFLLLLIDGCFFRFDSELFLFSHSL